MPAANLSIKKGPLYFSSPDSFKQFDFEEQIVKTLQDGNYTDLDHVENALLIFDLSKSYWHDLGALLWFVSLLHKLKMQRNELQLILPEPDDEKGQRVWDFLIRWRFFEALHYCVDDPVNLLRPHQVPFMMKQTKYAVPTGIDEYGSETVLHSLRILEITTLRTETLKQRDETLLGSFLEKYYDRVIILALSQLCGWDHSITRVFIQRVLREGILNSILHSEGSFANISMRLDAKYLTLVISDNGIGIPKVLRTAFKHKGSDVDLIKYFTEPDMIIDSRLIRISTEKGITSRPERKGWGLYYLKSLVLTEGGEIRIRSGKACVDFTQSKPNDYDNMLDSPGTMIRILAPLKR